jgi:two-component system sensor histidine kinase/response regulator
MSTRQTKSFIERRKVTRVPFFSRGLGLTLLSWFLLLALVPMTVVSLISYYNARNSLSEATEKSLFAIGESKTRFIDNWFNYRLLDLEVESSEVHNSQFLERLSEAFKKSGNGPNDFEGSPQYTQLTTAFGDDLKNFCRLYKYHDVLLIDNNGNILYTIAEENDLGTNVFTGINSDTAFSSMCKKVLRKGGSVYSDLSYYEPSGKITGFLGREMLNASGDQIGMMAFQIDPYVIDDNIQDRTGLGKTGEAYLVGTDFMMRSTSLLDEESTVLKVFVDTDITRVWQREHAVDFAEYHNEGVMSYTGRNGRQVIGMHHSIEIAGVPMAVIVEIEASEAYAAANRLGLMVIALVVVTSLIVLLIAITVSRVLVRPLFKLSDWAQQIAIGNLATESINAPSNEIGDIADSFAVLVKSLSGYYCSGI